MASIPLTLAALATSAVPGLVVHGAREHRGNGGGQFTSAVIISDDGESIVRIPRSQNAEVQQSAELLGLAALSDGARTRLPFDVPTSLGMTRSGDTRAVVTTFITGGRVDAADIEAEALLLQPIAEALAAIHELPPSIVHGGGLPVRTAEDVRIQAARLLDRAEATRLLPRTVHSRWTDVLGDTELWDFAPTVIHGALDADQLLITDDQIVGILGWSEFSVGDPATDLSWLLASGSEVLDAVIARYSLQRDAGHLRRFRARATLHHELDVARWLLHGVESHDQEVIDDAVSMLDRLVDRMSTTSYRLPTENLSEAAPLTEAEVEQLLDEVPEVTDHLSDTAAFEALDEDRVFGVDTDFLEPLPDESAPIDDSDSADPGNTAELGEAIGEQATEPIDPLDDSGDGDGAEPEEPTGR
ncbi:MAG: phosphotransferase [Leucobacter sp.]